MKNLSFLLLILLTFTTFNSCKEDMPQPSPGIYFYCKIDGVTFKPEFKRDWSYKSIRAKYTYWQDSTVSLLIGADNGDKRITLLITDNEIAINKHYLLQVNSSMNSGAYTENLLGLSTHLTDSVNTGELVLTKIDKLNKIVAGQFHFTAYDSTTNEVVQITDGQFYIPEEY